MFDGFFVNIDAFLNLAGNSPFVAMWYLFLKGGWIIFVITLLWGAKHLYLDFIRGRNISKKEYTLLRIAVPRSSEQTCKAVENMFASFAGAHSPWSWTEKWILGEIQSPISLEIVSVEGDVSYYIFCLRRMRDLVEAALYAQYPDADIEESIDYVKNVPHIYPDEEWDLWGTEMIPVNKNDAYPLKTYRDFEDQISGEFKDPIANMLEIFSRMGPGEQAWYQIVITPTDAPVARAMCEKLIKKLKGITEEHKKTFFDHLLALPVTVIGGIAEVLLGKTEAPKKKDTAKEAFPRMMALTPGERDVLEAVERKAAKILYLSKVRIVYVAKKEVMKKSRIANPFIGAIKQTNTADMQALKPENKKIGVNGTLWWFKDRRNDIRKMRLIEAYGYRSDWKGYKSFHLSTEEVATLWHFPILLQVKAPQLRRTAAKKSEPPANIPMEL